MTMRAAVAACWSLVLLAVKRRDSEVPGEEEGTLQYGCARGKRTHAEVQEEEEGTRKYGCVQEIGRASCRERV